jgi:hypothetical protein
MNSNTAVEAINRLINIIELCRETQSEIDNTYDLFCESVIREMTETIPKYDWSTKTRKKLRFHKFGFPESLKCHLFGIN